MNQDLTHVYFMPGMAANPSIFEHIKLPEERFEIHLLEWVIPEPSESIKSYAKRMLLYINHDSCILIGISFALINRIDSSKLYSVSLAAINFWLFLAFEIDKLNFEFSSFELILSKS